MKSEILNLSKEKYLVKISLIFIFFFPIILLTGSAIVNSAIVFMNIIFLIHIFKEKKLQIFNNDFFYLFITLWFFLIINTLLNDNFTENYSRSFGFIRFVFLVFLFSYFFSYKDFLFKKTILNVWVLIFIIVSLDLFFEFIFGFNTLGFKNIFDGRLSGFMGDELKIGHWYLCFSLIILSNFFNKIKKFYLFLFISIIISFLIGERANFIRLLVAILFLLTITRNLSFKSLVASIIIFITIFIVINNSEKNGENALRYRYIDQITNLFKHNSFKEFNDYNSYTPLYFNAYNLYKKNKTLGVGLGSFYEKSMGNIKKNKTINGYHILASTHPHQYHFEILATLGLPGYIIYFLFFIFFLQKSIRFYFVSNNAINLSSFLFVFVFLIPILPTGSFFTTYGASLFWLNFSLMNLGNFKNINY